MPLSRFHDSIIHVCSDCLVDMLRQCSRKVILVTLIVSVIGLAFIVNVYATTRTRLFVWFYLKPSILKVYHYDGIAYDFYSKDEISSLRVADQWEIWPLPSEDESLHLTLSPHIISKLPYVDTIYVMTDPSLLDRHANLRRTFNRQGISIDSIRWQFEWNRTTCNSKSNLLYINKRLNLKNKTLDREEQRKCALMMKHVDAWYEIAEKKESLSLILEDDAIFVSYFKEKFTRMIYYAIQNRILHPNQTCIKSIDGPIVHYERIHQNPMIVIGSCYDLHDESFHETISNASPILSTNKMSASRCTHAYLLTSCSAQALVDQIQMQKNDFLPSDFVQNYLFRLSWTLQSFWMDPPLVYQGNQIVDMDRVRTFKSQTY